MQTIICNIVLFCCLVSAGALPDQASIEEMASPKLRQFLSSQPVLLRELTNSLATTFANKRVRLFYFYSNAFETRAFHVYPDSTSVFINIPEDVAVLDEYLLLLYEAFNATHEKEFAAVIERTRAGKISRTDFPREISKIEFETVLQIKKKIKGFALDMVGSHYYERFRTCLDQFEPFFVEIKKSNLNTVSHYERQYDELLRTDKMDADARMNDKHNKLK